MVRASDKITEDRGFKSHLELGIFSKFPFDAKTYHVVISKKMVAKILYFVLAVVEGVAQFSYFTKLPYYSGEFSFFLKPDVSDKQ